MSILPLVFVFLLAVFALGSLLANPIVQSPTNETNLSGNVVLQVNLTVSENQNENVTNVSFMWENSSGLEFVFNTTIRNLTNTQTSNYTNTTFDTTALQDGIYNVTVSVTNITGGTINNVSIKNIIVDNTQPNVTFDLPLNGTNFTTSGNQQFNATVSDSPAGVKDVTFSFANGSTNIKDASINYSATNNSGMWNVTVDLSTFNDDIYTVIIYANDTAGNGSNAGNMNDTVNITVTIDGIAPNATFTAPTNGTNSTPSGDLLFNATVVDNLLGVRNVTFSLANGTTSIKDTSINYSATNNSGYWNVSVALSVLNDDVYTMILYANDTVGNVNDTENVTFTIDGTSPTITFDSANDTNFTSTYTINLSATVNDNLLDVQTVYFSISNGTTNMFNVTASNSSGAWNASVLGSRFTEGQHNISVVANDSVGNSNTSSNISIRIDTSKPNVTSVVISNIKEDAADLEAIGFDDATNLQSCALNSTTMPNGTLSRFNKTNFRKTIGGLVGDTTYSLTVNCTDTAGNFNDSNTVSFTTSAATASSSSSSSGGGGGGSSSQTTTSATPGVSKKKTWQALEPGLDVMFDVEDSDIPVTSIEFTAEQMMYGVWIKVENRETLPSHVTSFGRKVAQRLQLSKSSGMRESKISDLTLKFQVAKTWLSQNEVDKAEVSMWRYDGDAKEWTELATTLTGETTGEVQYSAVTPGFSYFVIGQGSGITAAAPEATAESVDGEAAPAGEDGSTDAEASEEAGAEETSGGASKWVLTIIVLLIIGGVAYYFYGRKGK